MPDIQTFWDSLKMSWSRRLMSKDCLWQKILQLNLMYANHEMSDIWFGGPNLLKSMAEKLSNLFWRETIKIIAETTEEIPFSHPHFFYHFNVFDNNLFGVNGTELKKDDFQPLWRKKISQVGDFFDCGHEPPKLLTLNQLNEKFSVHMNFLSYHRLKVSIQNAAKNLNYKTYDTNLSDTKMPRLPVIHKLSCLQSKGCGTFYQTLRAKELARRSTAESEAKWQKELGTIFSINFWDKIWKLNKGSFASNKMKWINLQINRFILPTNYTVNQYKPSQDPGCSFCKNHLEKLPSLLWECPVVREFWAMIGNILTFYFPQFKLGRKEAIFGDISTIYNSVLNTMLIFAKQFIWKQKFSVKNFDEVKYIIFMRQELKLLIDTMEFRGGELKLKFLNDWSVIFEHFEVES